MLTVDGETSGLRGFILQAKCEGRGQHANLCWLLTTSGLLVSAVKQPTRVPGTRLVFVRARAPSKALLPPYYWRKTVVTPNLTGLPRAHPKS